MKIYVIGMPGAGKTHFSRILSHSIRLAFFDLDDLIEKREGEKIRNIMQDKGETYFRKIEHETLLQVSTINNCVISCGGGTPMFYDHVELMKKNGILIWLNTDLDIISKRIVHNKTRRLLFIGLSEDEIRIKLTEIYEKRKKNYAKADIFIDNFSSNNVSLSPVIQKIMKLLKNRNNSM